MPKTNAIPETGLFDFLLWIVGFKKRFRVQGHSMQPLFQPGDEVLIDPQAYRDVQPQPDELVVARHPKQAGLKLIKRVMVVNEAGACFLVGDNPLNSTDSTTWGFVPGELIIGKVTNRFR